MDHMAGGDSPVGEQQQAAPEVHRAGAANGAVDVALLADKVYRLLLADLRLARARGTANVRRDG